MKTVPCVEDQKVNILLKNYLHALVRWKSLRKILQVGLELNESFLHKVIIPYQHGVLWQSSHKPSSISTWNFLHLRHNENSYFNTNSSPTEVFIKLLYTPSHLHVKKHGILHARS